MKRDGPTLLGLIVADVRRHPIPRMAGALAFFTLFALPAVALVVLALGGALYGDDKTRDDLLDHVEANLGPEARSTVATVIENTPRPETYVTADRALAVAALLFGATAAFQQLQAMLNRLWGQRTRTGWLRVAGVALKRLLSFLMVLGTGVVLIAYVAASTALAALEDEVSFTLDPGVRTFVSGGLEVLLSSVLLTANFVLLYKVLPDARVPWRSALYGALLAAALFLGGRHAVELYLRHAELATAYGAAGSLVVTLIWVFAAALFVLVGAVFSHAHASYRDARPDR